jgi:hypothetical protein
MATTDWQQIVDDRRGVRCRLTPRETYDGRPVRDDVRPFIGTDATLVPLWPMDDDDKYPGEWALGAPDYSDVFGRAWVASGDVTVLE